MDAHEAALAAHSAQHAMAAALVGGATPEATVAVRHAAVVAIIDTGGLAPMQVRAPYAVPTAKSRKLKQRGGLSQAARNIPDDLGEEGPNSTEDRDGISGHR